MSELPDRFPLPQDALAKHRSLLGEHIAHERAPRRRYPLLAAAALVLVVGTASAFAVRAAFDRDRPGLPPRAATPSTPTSGTFVLGYGGRPLKRGPGIRSMNQVWIYADGRVIWRREGGPYTVEGVRTGFLEQRLTRKGVARLRSEVLSTGLFDRDRAFSVPQLRPGGIQIRTRGRLVSMSWWQSPPGGPPPPRVATKAEARAAIRLSELLATRESLPASAWKDSKLRAYVPSRYAICYSGGSGIYPGQLPPDEIMDGLPPEARDLLRGRTRTYQSPLIGTNESRSSACSEVTTDEARSLEEVLTVAGFERRPRGFVWTIPPGSNPAGGLQEIWFDPILPHGQPVGPMGG